MVGKNDCITIFTTNKIVYENYMDGFHRASMNATAGCTRERPLLVKIFKDIISINITT